MKLLTLPKAPSNLFQITTETKLKGHLLLQKAFGTDQEDDRLGQINIVVGRSKEEERIKKIRILCLLRAFVT